MKIDSRKILKQIVAQRDCILEFMSDHGRESLFNDRLNRLCPEGREKAVVELALVCDCMTAIEAVLFSLNGAKRNQTLELHRFLRMAAKLFNRRDRKLYGEFVDLAIEDCERFLEIHYTDRGLFGGANRRTQWSGFRLSKQLTRVVGSNSPLNRYKEIFESVVMPLLDDHEGIEDILELGGVWTAIADAPVECTDTSINQKGPMEEKGNELVDTIEMANMNNPAILFDVIAGQSTIPVVKLNSQHNAFQNGHSFELLLQAWAQMEADAWDVRKQLLEDIRTDWGRVARDISQDEDGLSQ